MNFLINRSSKTKKTEIIMLVDNGSSQVNAHIGLRDLASQLSNKSGKHVYPVSVQHSNQITNTDVDENLGGVSAHVFSEFMADKLELGYQRFIFIPLFFGQSNAISSFIPEQIKLLKEEFSSFNLKMAKTLYPLPEGEPKIVNILYENLMSSIHIQDNSYPDNATVNADINQCVVLVDHGSPKKEVTAVRQHINLQLNNRLKEKNKELIIEQVVMERRSAKKFNFNGELLKDYLLRKAQTGEKHVIVLLLFLLPGTHAGEGGDISQICQSVIKQYPEFKISLSPLMSENSILIDCLLDRLNEFDKR